MHSKDKNFKLSHAMTNDKQRREWMGVQLNANIGNGGGLRIPDIYTVCSQPDLFLLWPQVWHKVGTDTSTVQVKKILAHSKKRILTWKFLHYEFQLILYLQLKFEVDISLREFRSRRFSLKYLFFDRNVLFAPFFCPKSPFCPFFFQSVFLFYDFKFENGRFESK